MEKKRSIGVTVFGISLLLIAGIYITVVIVDFLQPMTHYENSRYDRLNIALLLLWALLIISSIGILKLKNWARIISLLITWIVCTPIVLCSPMAGKDAYMYFIPGLLIIVLITFFLTHPKVKEQFR